jgi:hypothetical protein
LQNPPLPIVTSSASYTIESIGGVAGTIVPIEMQRSATNGDALKEPINTLLPVFTSLSFNPPSAGDLTQLTFTFVPNDEIDTASLNKGVVTFILPGFTGGGDAGITLTSPTHITMGSPQADGAFISGYWLRAGTATKLKLTVDPQHPAQFDKPQIVIIKTTAGIKLPADGLTSAQSTLQLKIGPDNKAPYDWTQATSVSVVGMDLVLQHINGLSVNYLAPRGTVSLGPAIVPQHSTVRLAFSEEVAGVFASGDKVSLRATSTTCYASRTATGSSSRSADIVLSSLAVGTLDASALGAVPTTYNLCYVGTELTALAGVDSETGITISVQSYVTSIDLIVSSNLARGLPAPYIKVSSWPYLAGMCICSPIQMCLPLSTVLYAEEIDAYFP